MYQAYFTKFDNESNWVRGEKLANIHLMLNYLT